jgi:hypothetical protein
MLRPLPASAQIHAGLLSVREKDRNGWIRHKMIQLIEKKQILEMAGIRA